MLNQLIINVDVYKKRKTCINKLRGLSNPNCSNKSSLKGKQNSRRARAKEVYNSKEQKWNMFSRLRISAECFFNEFSCWDKTSWEHWGCKKILNEILTSSNIA